jgi:hypothetical protein
MLAEVGKQALLFLLTAGHLLIAEVRDRRILNGDQRPPLQENQIDPPPQK